MKNEFFNAEIDNIIRESVKLTDKPGTELNNKLKAELYQKEAAMRKQPTTRTLVFADDLEFHHIYDVGCCCPNGDQ